MNKKDTVVFDLDGTLLDTLEDLKNSVNYAMTQCGYPEHTLDIYLFYFQSVLEKSKISAHTVVSDKPHMSFARNQKSYLTISTLDDTAYFR